MTPAGTLGDDCDLTRRARRYANEVLDGAEWPLSRAEVDLTLVRFETSTRMKRRHGVCVGTGDGCCTIRLSAETDRRAGREAIRETIRHELVHVYQRQTDGVETGHGDSFQQWVEPLDLSGRCSRHYERRPSEYKYRFYCQNGCGFVGGRHRWSAVVERAIRATQRCGNCHSPLRVENEDGVLQRVPPSRE